ncbi:hypothetical protein P12x_004774 [Tundrisphaera lichenicola]|uniref:hypothetical protein n=1 Tax=Tundrisphaera lichenicola TaxID=2029860 RepID=UPI003EC14629
MEGSDRAPWFLGDLDDPWVVAIADAIPRARRFHHPDDLPDSWPIDGVAPPAVILHRRHLTVADAHRVVGLRSRWERPPRIILCVGPQARYADVECWSRLVEVVIPEATALDTVARHALESGSAPRAGGNRPRVALVSTDRELRVALAETCRSAGYLAEARRDWSELAPDCPVVWDVPVLEAGWGAQLSRRATTSTVVALLGFADRATVRASRAAGASACLELPCDSADLIATLDRVVSRPRIEPAHSTPPPPMGSRLASNLKR